MVVNCRILLLLMLVSAALRADAQGTAFTYQGRLNVAGAPANGSYDFQFAVYNVVAGGSPVSATLTNSAVSVSNGLFTVTLDFGPGIFTGANEWLDLAVRPAGPGVFTGLAPRQPVLPVPYAIFATGASNLFGTLGTTQLVGALPSAQIAGTYTSQVSFANASNSLNGTFIGNGGSLTNLNGSQVTFGTVADARLTPNVALLNTNQTFSGVNSFTNGGNSFTGNFIGNGALVTNLNGTQVTTGTVADMRLSTNVAFLNGNQTFSGSNVFTSANSFTGSNYFNGANNFTNRANNFTGSFFGNGLVGWIVVSNTAVTALPDTGYLLTSPQFTTVSLPPSASLYIGDIVRISGAGAGGWCVGQGTNQSIIGNFVSYRPSLWLVSSAGSANWLSLAASDDSTIMYAASSAGVSTSTDAGHTWSGNVISAGSWNAVATSANGQTVFAVTTGTSKAVQISTNAGATSSWSDAPGSGVYQWVDVACSSDGKSIIASRQSSLVYTNNPASPANSWASIGATGNNWGVVAYAGNGGNYAAGSANGNVFSKVAGSVNLTNRAVTGLVISADGTKLAACVNPGGIYTSTNSGANWNITTAPLTNWGCLTASADCTRLIAGVSSGLIYASANFGANWSPLSGSTNQVWSALAASADGTKLAGAVNSASGQIYYSAAAAQSTTSTNGTLTGSQGSAVELQYIGNNQFMPVSSAGTLWAN